MSTCTAAVLATVAIGLNAQATCGDRIQWVIDNLGKSEADACQQVGEEFPPLCGLCAPQGIHPSPPPPPRFPVGTGTLRVLSFNILFSADGQWNWANRGDNILEMIDLLDPDLIGLQENDARNPAGGASHGFYPSSRLVQDRPVYAAVSGGGDMVNTILYKADRFTVRDSGRTTLSDVVPWRHVGWALFHDGLTGQHLYHYNTHWNHYDADADGWLGHGLRMMETIRSRAFPQYPLVATGDFNCHFNAPGNAYLRGEWAAQPNPLPMRDTWQDIHGESYDGAGSYGSPQGNHRIDFVFAPVGQFTTLDAEVFWNAKVISDHLPVLAVLAY